MNRFRAYLPALLVIVCLLLGWEAYARTGIIQASTLPAPSAVIQALFKFRSLIWYHTFQTIVETVIGLSLAIILGTLSSLTIFELPSVRKAVYPLLVVSQTIPLIALAPLLLIWFGFDLTPKLIIVVLYCFFPITVSMTNGLLGTDAYLVDLAKSMKATRLQRLRFVHIPAALPAFFAGLRISVIYAVTAAVVGEYVGAYRGLGIYMQTAAHSRATTQVFAAILVIVILSLILLGVVVFIEKRLLGWWSKSP